VRDEGLLDELLCRVSCGDEEAFERLYRETSKQVFAYLLSVVGEYHTAEDLTQDTFVKIPRSADKYRSGNAFAWIMQIAKNTAFSEMKKARRSVPTDFDEHDLNAAYRIDEGQIPVLEIIRTRLDAADSKIVLMHLAAGLKHREIAKQLDMPLGTTLWRYNKAIKTLQKIIKEEYGE